MASTRTPAEAVATSQVSARGVWRQIDKADLARVALVAACALVVLVGLDWPSPRVPGLAVAGLALGLWPIVAESWQALRARRISMEVSMLLAIVAAAAIGEWVTALAVCAFALAAEILEDLVMDRGRDALTDLMAFLPAEIQVVADDGQVVSLPADQVRVGQVVMVPPGGRVSVDGVIVAGASSVDQSRITGEPMPVDVTVGDAVLAGSVNATGMLQLRATQVGTDSSYGRIVEAVRAAQASRAPVQRLADKVAAWLVWVALAGAAVTLLVTRDWPTAISVVIVAGACGIAAGTPLAVLAAIARAARRGAFVKDGTHLEQLSAVDTVIVDKTGTVTVGQPRVASVHPAGSVSARQLLAQAAAVEAYSEHPIGQAIVAHARAEGLALPVAEDFVNTAGVGVQATVAGRRVRVGRVVGAGPAGQASLVRVVADDQVLGDIWLADEVRASAPAALARLAGLGMRLVMLTGDSQAVAQQVGAQVGIADARGDLLPDDKLAVVRAQRAAGRRVAMVGDGVNDAPALAQADVGIAMGSGTEIARHTADIVLISSDLDDLASVVRTARRARGIIMFNFIGTLVVDAIGMALAGFGLIGPTVAALIHVVSESAFIINSARLLPGAGRRQGGDRT